MGQDEDAVEEYQRNRDKEVANIESDFENTSEPGNTATGKMETVGGEQILKDAGLMEETPEEEESFALAENTSELMELHDSEGRKYGRVSESELMRINSVVKELSRYLGGSEYNTEDGALQFGDGWETALTKFAKDKLEENHSVEMKSNSNQYTFGREKGAVKSGIGYTLGARPGDNQIDENSVSGEEFAEILDSLSSQRQEAKSMKMFYEIAENQGSNQIELN